MPVPSERILLSDVADRFGKGAVNLCLRQLIHSEANVITIASEAVFHGREAKFNRVVIWRVWW